jgi:hypothetical protein
VLGHRTIPEIQAQTRVEIQTHLHALRNIPMPPTYATQLVAFGAHLIDQNVSQFQMRELRTQKSGVKKHRQLLLCFADAYLKTLLTQV